MRSKWLLLTAVLFFVTGCATMKKKFTESKSVNFGPFADQTLLLLSSLDYDLNPNEAYRLSPYLDLSIPDIKLLHESVVLERKFLKGIIAYSLEIVNLSESSLSQAEQVKAYRDYISQLVTDVVSAQHSDVALTKERGQQILDDIGRQSTLLDALQKARPLILEFNQINLRLIRSIGKAREGVVLNIQTNMDSAFEGFLAFDLSLRGEKLDVTKGLEGVREYKKGNSDALKNVRSINGLLPQDEKGKDVYSIEKYLNERLVLLEKRQTEIQRDLEQYHQLKATLGRVVRQHDEMIRAGGRAVLVWSQAHQKMANGIFNPAEWIGMSDVKNLATGAVKTVVP